MNLLTIIFPLVAVVGGVIALAYINRNDTKASQVSKRVNSKASKNKTQEEMRGKSTAHIR
ncbi:hypothetical protein EHE19_004160 [Ruminiclostridium herbifermentans]|uniref:Uncharacterized protein n=1 Tax=Ruminiclostridium herbifermentans TaxID=2488810 RepID=A0A4V6ENL6_9FIRM|nr:hypothetical protein [Ruminiclostridium herbifermentans]QNU67675.1 hypothetical protein EHE19_004160 [Ruminiclostridium herbifermentans]